MEHDPAGVVRAYWERIWNDGDIEAVDQLVSDPYVRHSAYGNALRTRAQVRKDMARYLAAIHRADATIDDQAVAGDMVWTRLTLRGVNVETGDPVLLSWLHVARVEHGRVAEAWHLTAPVDWATPPRPSHD